VVKQWTLEDLNSLAKASEELKALGVLSIGIGYRQTCVHVGRETLAQLAALLCQQPRKEAHRSKEFWICTLECGDLEFYALFRPEELPMIGYPAEPLPSREEEPAEPALQAS